MTFGNPLALVVLDITTFTGIYIGLLLYLISVLILVMLGLLHYVHFSCFDICTSVIEKVHYYLSFLLLSM